MLQASLGNAFQVEKTHHVGEKGALGIDPVWIGLQIEPTNAQLPNPFSSFGVEVGAQLHPAGPACHGLQQGWLGLGDYGRKPAGHLICRADLLGVVPWEVEITGMGPEREALLIESH